MRLKGKIDSMMLSTGLNRLLNDMGIQIPFASDAIKIAVNAWVNTISTSEQEKYAEVLSAAERTGISLRKTVRKFQVETEEAREKAKVSSVFIAGLLASFFQEQKQESES
jgi:hypothetical protein